MHMYARALCRLKAQQLHSMLSSVATTTLGDPLADQFMTYIARYQQARTASDYFDIAERCLTILECPDLSQETRSWYTWLAWLSRWQLEEIGDRQ